MASTSFFALALLALVAVALAGNVEWREKDKSWRERSVEKTVVRRGRDSHHHDNSHHDNSHHRDNSHHDVDHRRHHGGDRVPNFGGLLLGASHGSASREHKRAVTVIKQRVIKSKSSSSSHHSHERRPLPPAPRVLRAKVAVGVKEGSRDADHWRGNGRRHHNSHEGRRHHHDNKHHSSSSSSSSSSSHHHHDSRHH